MGGVQFESEAKQLRSQTCMDARPLLGYSQPSSLGMGVVFDEKQAQRESGQAALHYLPLKNRKIKTPSTSHNPSYGMFIFRSVTCFRRRCCRPWACCCPVSRSHQGLSVAHKSYKSASISTYHCRLPFAQPHLQGQVSLLRTEGRRRPLHVESTLHQH